MSLFCVSSSPLFHPPSCDLQIDVSAPSWKVFQFLKCISRREEASPEELWARMHSCLLFLRNIFRPDTKLDYANHCERGFYNCSCVFRRCKNDVSFSQMLVASTPLSSGLFFASSAHRRGKESRTHKLRDEKEEESRPSSLNKHTKIFVGVDMCPSLY